MRDSQEKLIKSYKIIDKAPNLEKYSKDSINMSKHLNEWTISVSASNCDFLREMNDYIIGDENTSLSKLIIDELKSKKMHISCAESCTGGMLISRLIDASGASSVIEESYITYSNEAKIRILDVKKETIDKYSVTSLEVADEMAEGILIISKADIAVSVTGFAGGKEKLPTDGLCYFCIKVKGKKELEHLEKIQVEGNRYECRYAQSTYIMWRVLQILKKI